MSKNKTKYSPTDALKLLEGVSKNSLYDDMKNGNISYTEEPWGKRKRRIIDGAELTRYYGDKFNPANIQRSTQSNNLKQPQTRLNGTETTLKIKLLEQDNNNLNERLEEAQKERDDWKKQAQTLLLRPPESQNKQKGFFSKLFS